MSPEQYGEGIVGVSGRTVRRLELGFPMFLSTQKKFAKALDTDIEDLFGLPKLPEVTEAEPVSVDRVPVAA